MQGISSYPIDNAIFLQGVPHGIAHIFARMGTFKLAKINQTLLWESINIWIQWNINKTYLVFRCFRHNEQQWPWMHSRYLMSMHPGISRNLRYSPRKAWIRYKVRCTVEFTANVCFNSSTISSPSSIMCDRTAVACGILSIFFAGWCVYWRRARNSGPSTVVKGWSVAAIHFARRSSKCCWSHGFW